jgi:hypothetical protein
MNGDDAGCAGGMWYDVSCATVKYLAICRVPGVAPPQRRLLYEMEARDVEIISLKAENAALKNEISAREAEIVALKGRDQDA